MTPKVLTLTRWWYHSLRQETEKEFGEAKESAEFTFEHVDVA